MSHYMTALAMRQTGLKPATKIVLYWIAEHHNGQTGQCNPSINRLAKCCEMSRRSVEIHIANLEASGLLSRSQSYREYGGKSTNSYTLFLSESDAQNLRGVCAKSARGVCAKSAHDRTLEDTNLGKEPTPKPPKGADDLFLEKKEDQTKPSESDGIEEGFNEFWNEIWPSHTRKTGKADCRKVYRSACEGKHPKADRITPQDLNAATRRYIASVNDRQFLKGPLPWLRLPGWESFVQSTGGKMDWSTLTDSQKRMLERGECPPSMQGPNGEPTALAQAYLSEVAR